MSQFNSTASAVIGVLEPLPRVKKLCDGVVFIHTHFPMNYVNKCGVLCITTQLMPLYQRIQQAAISSALVLVTQAKPNGD